MSPTLFVRAILFALLNTKKGQLGNMADLNYLRIYLSNLDYLGLWLQILSHGGLCSIQSTSMNMIRETCLVLDRHHQKVVRILYWQLLDI